MHSTSAERHKTFTEHVAHKEITPGHDVVNMGEGCQRMSRKLLQQRQNCDGNAGRVNRSSSLLGFSELHGTCFERHHLMGMLGTVLAQDTHAYPSSWLSSNKRARLVLRGNTCHHIKIQNIDGHCNADGYHSCDRRLHWL